jgi:hypothetical protein
MFYRIASVPFKVIGSFDKFRRFAASSGFEGNLIDAAVFEKLSPVYKVSPDPKDYGFLSALAVRANVPNNNGDAVSKEELFRYRPFILFEVHRTFDEEDEIHALKMLKGLGYGIVVMEPRSRRNFIVYAYPREKGCLCFEQA